MNFAIKSSISLKSLFSATLLMPASFHNKKGRQWDKECEFLRTSYTNISGLGTDGPINNG
jgi:hypothetical protein